MSGNRNTGVIGLDNDLWAMQSRVGKGYSQALTQIMYEEVGEKRITAAYLLLGLDGSDDGATKIMIQVLETGEDSHRRLAASYLARLERLPAAMVLVLNKILLERGNMPLCFAASLALRDASPLAMEVLKVGFESDDYKLRILAASALGRVAESARPTVSTSEIMAVMTGQLPTASEEDQFVNVMLLGEMGPVAAPAIPTLLEMLEDPFVRLATRTIIIRVLGQIGQKAEAVRSIQKVLSRAILARDWTGVFEATQSLAALGEAPSKAIGDLTKLLKSSETERQKHALLGFKNFGPLAEPAIPALIKWIRSQTSAEMAPAWAAAIGSVGAPAVRPLIDLARTSDIGVWPWAASALTLAGAEGLTAVVDLVLTDPSREVRDLGAALLHSRGKRAEAAIPAIVALLQAEGGEKHLEAAVVALKGMGAGARDAAPALVRLLLDGSEPSKRLAREAIINIGPDAIPALQAAFGSANEEGKERITELLARWNFKVGPDPLDLIDLNLLQFFAEYGQLVKERGPMSAERASKIMGAGSRTISKWIKALEIALGGIRLTDRIERRKGALTNEGEKIHREILVYLKRKGWPPRTFDN